MGQPIIDFSHLTPAERIELAEQLWDSLEPAALELDEPLTADLRRRRGELEADGDLGAPWTEALDEIEKRGA